MSEKIKYMDYLQNTISRIASHSFQLKGWAITIDTAILTLFANNLKSGNQSSLILLIPIIPTVMFWILDASFLSIERRLRMIFSEVVKDNYPQEKLFLFPLAEYKQNLFFVRALFSRIMITLYGGLILLFVVFFCISTIK